MKYPCLPNTNTNEDKPNIENYGRRQEAQNKTKQNVKLKNKSNYEKVLCHSVSYIINIVM